MSGSKKPKSVLEKEADYQRINAELEAKTAALVKEADNLLNKSIGKVNQTPLFDEAANNYDEDHSDNSDEYDDDDDKSLNVNSAGDQDVRLKINEIAKTYDNKSMRAKPSQPAAAENNAKEDENCLEIQNRYLKAKLRVIQEDNEKLANDLLKKQEEYTGVKSRIKELEDERNKLQRTNNNQSIQMDKTKKLLDESKSKMDILETHISALKKELEQSKRNLDQHNSSSKGNEVRLNRALEENTKLKSQLSQLKSTQKDLTDADKKKTEQLLADNKKLERQKAELIQAFRKQMQLIDVLKRQKMQVEVAKMLQFTEEEFVKALDWEK